MNIQEHTTPDKLERYSFLWSEVKLVIAAVSLAFGASPIVFMILPGGLARSLLTLSWIISGLAALYLGYRWYTGGRKVFGGTNRTDMIAFGVMVVSGINLGFTGISSNNIGMSLVPYGLSTIIFIATAVLYLWTAYYLWKRWKAHGEHLFSPMSSSSTPTPVKNV